MEVAGGITGRDRSGTFADFLGSLFSLQKEYLVVAVYGNDGLIHDMIKHVPEAWK
jgi:hypothetical protein